MPGALGSTPRGHPVWPMRSCGIPSEGVSFSPVHMHDLKFRLAWPAFLCAGLLTGFSLAPTALSQTLVPADVGTTVNGYQDDFDGAGSRWACDREGPAHAAAAVGALA